MVEHLETLRINPDPLLRFREEVGDNFVQYLSECGIVPEVAPLTDPDGKLVILIHIHGREVSFTIHAQSGLHGGNINFLHTSAYQEALPAGDRMLEELSTDLTDIPEGLAPNTLAFFRQLLKLIRHLRQDVVWNAEVLGERRFLFFLRALEQYDVRNVSLEIKRENIRDPGNFFEQLKRHDKAKSGQ